MKNVHATVVQMRENGETYKEISQTTGLAISTISYVVNKHLPKNKNAEISSRNDRAHKQTPAFKTAQKRRNDAAKAKYVKEHDNLKNDYLIVLRSYFDQRFVYYISGLYEGEGTHHGTTFDFCNSDAKLIQPFLKFIREVLLFPEDRFSLRLSLPTSLAKEKCVSYWENLCEHELQAVDQYDNRTQRKTYRHNKHRNYFGTITIRVKRPNGLKSALKAYTY